MQHHISKATDHKVGFHTPPADDDSADMNDDAARTKRTAVKKAV